MATDHDYPAHHADVAYERRDLSHRGIWAFFIFLGVSAAVIFLAIGALYKGFGYAQVKLATPGNPMAQSNAIKTEDKLVNTVMVDLTKFSQGGKQPLLQVNEPVDMQNFRAEEDLLLNSAPWKDEKGDIHIPIDQAMQLVTQRTLPTRPNGNDPSTHDPKVTPSEQGFAAFALAQQSADAAAVEENEGEQAPPAEKPETHSITPSAKRNAEMPEKK